MGDTVLKVTAELGLRLRGVDDITVYRYGGEEITVIFRQFSLGKAKSYLEKWLMLLNSRKFREEDLRVSFSAGVCHGLDVPVKDIMNKVDSLLYKAKADGKNRVYSDS